MICLSQVIMALIDFFKSRNESHRFVVLAPTGTAAALLHGLTYHSFLGVPIDGQPALRNEMTSNSLVQARLDRVEYIFLDEVSMVLCDNNYKSSAPLPRALNEFDLPYGGINMIFSRDFAQLSPVFGSALYSGTVGTKLISHRTIQGQKAAIGKALWHQVTTIGILDIIILQLILELCRVSECYRFHMNIILGPRTVGKTHKLPYTSFSHHIPSSQL